MPLGLKRFYNRRPQLLGRLLVILERFSWRLEFLRVLVQRVIRQMHVQVLQIGLVGLSIVMRTESRETLIVEIGLDWVDAANEDVETGIEFLLVYQERIIDVPLNLEFVMESTFRQFREFLDQHYTLSTAAFRGFRDKCLAVVLPQMKLEITELIG